MNIKKSLVAAMAVALIGAAQSAGALQSTSSFTVNITITPACTVTVPGGNITFLTPPNGNPNGETGTTTINAKCTNTTPYVINLSGTNPGAVGTGAGNMIGAGAPANPDIIAYQLFRPDDSTPWGNGGVPATPANGLPDTGTGSLAGLNYTVHAHITGSTPAFPTPDSYQDTVNVDLEF